MNPRCGSGSLWDCVVKENYLSERRFSIMMVKEDMEGQEGEGVGKEWLGVARGE